MAEGRYDELVVVSFGGPEGPNDVMPFLQNVTRGRDVPRERLEAVAAHYLAHGGVSPINAANRALVAEIETAFDREGIDLPVRFGNRNWHPFLTDTLTDMARDGVERALAFVTSAFSSYSGCRQYLEDIDSARAAAGPDAPEIDKIRVFGDHPLFVAAVTDRIVAATGASAPQGTATWTGATRLVFTAHSLPEAAAASCDYVAQLNATAARVASGLPVAVEWDLVYQSRSGPPQVPWLGPDVNDHIETLAASGTTHVVVVPLGFVSDHMEVVHDLDTEAAATAAKLGVTMTRVPTVGTHPSFVEMVVELVRERLDPALPRRSIWSSGARADVCPAACCPPPGRPARRP